MSDLTSTMNYIFIFFVLTFIPVVTSRKILRSLAGNSSAEILNSSVQGLDEFTLCGRIFSHQFSSVIQTFLHFPSDELYSVALGTWPGYPCETFFQGKILTFWGKNTHVLNLRMH